MNPSQAEQLTSQDILLLRSLLGRFGGELTQAPPSTPAPTGPLIPIQPNQPSSLATQPAEPLTQSVPMPIPDNGIQPLQQPRHSVFPHHPSYPSIAPSYPAPSYPAPSYLSIAPSYPSIAPAIIPYHSALPGSQGHPPRSTRISSTVENIGMGITSQVNQQRLAAAAVNLPSHVSLPQRTARRRHRGPAISPPTLAPTFSIHSVISNDHGSGSSPSIRIKVKIYPPQASFFC